MGDERALIQSRSGMIHVEGCPESHHDAGALAGVAVRASEIEMIGPYSRCARCAPPVPATTTTRVEIVERVGDLTQSDIGRDTELGRIDEIRHRADAIAIDFAHGCTWVFAPRESIALLGAPDAAAGRIA